MYYIVSQTFLITKVHISEKLKGVIMKSEIWKVKSEWYYFLYEDEFIAKFSYRH